MNLVEMLRFDELRYQSKRTVPEQVEYDILLERVLKGVDGLSEFPTEDSEIVKSLLEKQLCDAIVDRIKSDFYVYGPKVAAMVIEILLASVKR